MANNVILTPEVVECVNMLQTGGAELWNTTIRKALDCVVYSDDYGTAEERLKLAQELLCVQDIISTFIPKGGTR